MADCAPLARCFLVHPGVRRTMEGRPLPGYTLLLARAHLALRRRGAERVESGGSHLMLQNGTVRVFLVNDQPSAISGIVTVAVYSWSQGLQQKFPLRADVQGS